MNLGVSCSQSSEANVTGNAAEVLDRSKETMLTPKSVLL
jgi:hypothetical protein